MNFVIGVHEIVLGWKVGKNKRVKNYKVASLGVTSNGCAIGLSAKRQSVCLLSWLRVDVYV